MNPLDLIQKYYADNEPLYRLLVHHSKQVTERALAIIDARPALAINRDFVAQAAMLHDIGVFLTDAPGIHCHGTEPYLMHGYLGAELMRKEGFSEIARVCERHTGTGLTPEVISERNLPLPMGDYRPQTLEEQLICYADKFYSKTKLDKEKSVEKVKQGLSKYGNETVERFDNWCKLFLGE